MKTSKTLHPKPNNRYMFLSFFFMFLFVSPSFSQTYSKIDSLKQILNALPPINNTDADTLRMQVSIEIGDLYEYHQPDSAIWWYKSIADTVIDAETISKHPERSFLNATALRYIGIVHRSQGRIDEAVYYYHKSLDVFKELDNKRGVSACLNSLGVAMQYQGNFPKALDYYERSLEIMIELDDKNGISACLNNLGMVARFRGDYPQAVKYYEKSLKIRKELDDKQGVAASFNNLGIVEHDQGNFPKALKYYEKSLRIREEIGDARGISRCINNMGSVAFNQGNYPLAMNYYERALRVYEELNDVRGISSCLNNLGSVSQYLGNYLQAINYFERSLEIREETGDKMGISACLNNLGNVLQEQGDYIKAEQYFKRALNIFEELGDKNGTAICLNNLGMLNNDKGEYLQAIDYFERSTLLFEELGNKSSLALVYPLLAKAYINSGKPEKATELFYKSKDLTLLLLQENFTVLSENEKEMYLERTKSVFNDLHYFNNTFDSEDQTLAGVCYNNELIMKGLLLKSTRAILDAVYESPDPQLKETYFRLRQLRNEIAAMQSIPMEYRRVDIELLEKEANELERKLVRLSAEFADLQEIFTIDWKNVQKALKPGEAAIEFVQFSEGKNNENTVYAALILKHESTQPETVRLFEENKLNDVLNLQQGTQHTFVNNLYGTKESLNTTLYESIWKPLEQYLKGIHAIYYSPTAVLNKVAFAAINVDENTLLSDYYQLYQLSTTGTLISTEQVSVDEYMTAAIFGGIKYSPPDTEIEQWKYLPGTLEETKRIKALLSENHIKTVSYTGIKASEEQLKALFSDEEKNPGILHIATHGFFYPCPATKRREMIASGEIIFGEVVFRGSERLGIVQYIRNNNPMMRSGLVLADANRIWTEDYIATDNDGVLTAYEVSNMNMRNTQLVVLSACETGLGDIHGSEGVYGLQRAFKMAGVKYLIMSLWQVPDKETAEFMEVFYTNLLDFKDVRKAFSETQREMRQKYDPFFWAAFVLVE